MKSSQKKTDHYRVLEVESWASPEEIKRAFRKLAFQHHPDRNPDDREAEVRFKSISHAYQVLGDEKSRRFYDLGLDSLDSGFGARWGGFPGSTTSPFGARGGMGRGMGRCGGGMGRGCGRGSFAAAIQSFFESASEPSPDGGPQSALRPGIIQIDPMEAATGCERMLHVRSTAGVMRMRLEIPPGIDDGTVIRLVAEDPHVQEILLQVQIRSSPVGDP
jgi:DnaJ-class molecular chaperone